MIIGLSGSLFSQRNDSVCFTIEQSSYLMYVVESFDSCQKLVDELESDIITKEMYELELMEKIDSLNSTINLKEYREVERNESLLRAKRQRDILGGLSGGLLLSIVLILII